MKTKTWNGTRALAAALVGMRIPPQPAVVRLRDQRTRQHAEERALAALKKRQRKAAKRRS
ncbi:MAG: hypothetical protein KGJ21_09910 [Pseudomonadota bacterium]|nr:hypothetical protein [Pseudomonadota bacterium]